MESMGRGSSALVARSRRSSRPRSSSCASAVIGRSQLSLFEDRDGWRYQIVATNTAHTPGQQLAFLEARHRAHARVEDRIRHAKDTGLGRFPSREFAINQAWLQVVTLAADLTAWLRLLALPDPLKTCEPKALRYRLLHVPARLTPGAP